MHFLASSPKDGLHRLFISVKDHTSPLAATQDYKGPSPFMFDLVAGVLGQSEYYETADKSLKNLALSVRNIVQEKNILPTYEYCNNDLCHHTGDFVAQDEERTYVLFLKENSNGGVTVVEKADGEETVFAEFDDLNFKEIRDHLEKFNVEFGESDSTALNNTISTCASSSSCARMEEPVTWSDFDEAAKVKLITFIQDHPSTYGNTKITLLDGNVVHVGFRFKDSGTSSSVYSVSIGESIFSLKILLPGMNAGESAQKLQNHTIEGLVPLFSAESVEIKGKAISVDVIVMGYLEVSLPDKFKTMNSFTATESIFVLKCLQRLAQCLDGLKQAGFHHGDIGLKNVMLDAENNAYLVDIDDLPSTAKYTEAREGIDVRGLTGLLEKVIYACNLKGDHPLNKFWGKTLHISTISDYLQAIERQLISGLA